MYGTVLCCYGNSPWCVTRHRRADCNQRAALFGECDGCPPMCACVGVHGWYMCLYVYVHACVCACVGAWCVHVWGWVMCVCLGVCMYVVLPLNTTCTTAVHNSTLHHQLPIKFTFRYFQHPQTVTMATHQLG